MITLNGKQVVIKPGNKEAEDWAKGAVDRILSHYTEEELETMRKQNGVPVD